jgi:uncharacterized FlaG/YvyC family protein
MKLPNWLKILWWVLLTVILSILLYKRYEAILTGAATPFDIFAFVIWAALLLVPLFQEVSFFGVTLKQEIEELKAHVKAEITGLKSEIQNSIDMRTNISPQFFLQPPNDAQIAQLEDQVQSILKENLNKHGLKEPVKEAKQITVPESADYLFKVRYNIETELARIYEDSTGKERRPIPVHRLLEELVSLDVMPSEIAFVVRKVYSTCTPAIHGEAITEAQLHFVEETAPEVITSLKAIASPKATSNNRLQPTAGSVPVKKRRSTKSDASRGGG